VERLTSVEAGRDAYELLAKESMALNVRLTAQLEAARPQIKRNGPTR